MGGKREKQSQLPRLVTTERGIEAEAVKDAERIVSENQVKVSSAPHCPVKGGTGMRGRQGKQSSWQGSGPIASSPSARAMPRHVPASAPYPVSQVEKLRPKMARL